MVRDGFSLMFRPSGDCASATRGPAVPAERNGGAGQLLMRRWFRVDVLTFLRYLLGNWLAARNAAVRVRHTSLQVSCCVRCEPLSADPRDVLPDGVLADQLRGNTFRSWAARGRSLRTSSEPAGAAGLGRAAPRLETTAGESPSVMGDRRASSDDRRSRVSRVAGHPSGLDQTTFDVWGLTRPTR
jgi:hypothetical protein